MPNLKFSQFQEQTDPANVQFVVGYNGTNNVRIAPGDLGGGYPFLIDTQSLYSGFVPSGLSGNPQGNTVLGISASSSATTGFNNTALGYGALSGNTTGSYNTAVGNNALSAASTTSYNTAIGHSAGRLTTGTLNTFLGEQAGEAVTVGQDNVFLGAVAGYQNTSTTSNTILIGYNTNTSPVGASNFIVLGNANHTTLQIPGIQSGASNGDVLTYNATFGKLELQTPSSGGATDLNGLTDCLVDTDSLYVGEVPAGLSANPQGNTVLGIDAGSSLQTQQGNTLIGNDAGKNFGLNPFANGITYVGAFAGLNNTSGGGTTYIGYQAGQNQAGAANTAVGHQALGGSFSGSGTSNIAIGDRAGLSARGSQSTLLGYQTAYSSGTGLNDSILIGYRAGYSTNAANVVQIGSEAGRNNNSAAGHISIGYQAGYSQTSGANNTNLGFEAGYSNTSGAFRTVIGYQAGKSQTGGANTFIGSLAGGSRSGSGTQNVAIGNNALRYLENADNTAIGSAAGQYADSTSSKNVMIGSQAMAGAFGSKSNNVAVGYKSGFAATTGGDNTLIGYQAGLNVTTSASNTVLGSNALGYHNGNNNVAIGGNAMQGSASFTGTGTDNVAIGYNAGSGSSPTAFSNSILIGKDAATSPIGISNVIAIGNSSQTVLQMPGITSGASNGDVLMYDTANFPFNNLKLYPSGTTPSDARDKKDIEDLPYGLEFVNSLQPRKYVWDNRVKTIERESFDEDGNPITITEEFVANEKGTIGFGFIAQELQEVDNEVLQLVNDSNEDSLRINYSKLVPVLVQAIKELKAEIELLKS
jgi:hypothetical protein